MSDRPTPETDADFPALKRAPNGTAVWVQIGRLRNLERNRDEARELVWELRDAITPFVGLNPSSPRVKVKWPDFVERAKAVLAKVKEVLP